MPRHSTAALEQNPSFWRHLRRATPVIIGISLLTLLMHDFGWLKSFENATLDTWLRLKSPLQPHYVIIVRITEEDYQGLFGGTSPLDRKILQKVLRAIASGRPQVIGVDLDTAEVDLRPKTDSDQQAVWPADIPVVWARDAIFNQEGKPEKLFPVLTEEPPTVPSGIASLPQDSDCRIRRYQRTFLQGQFPSFHWAIVKEFCSTLHRGTDNGVPPSENFFSRVFHWSWNRLSQVWHYVWSFFVKSPFDPQTARRFCTSLAEHAEEAGEALVFNFSRERSVSSEYHSAFDSLSVEQILKIDEELQKTEIPEEKETWSTHGPLTGKIVLLGGSYHAARDEHRTPLGTVYGVDLMAQAIESELQGGGIRPFNEFFMFLVELITGVALVWLHYYCHSHLGWLVLLSLGAIPLLAMFASLFVFSTMALWVDFIPLLFGVLIHQLYDHAREYRRMYQALQEQKGHS